MKDKQYKISGYNITGDPAYMKDLFPVPPELERQLEDLHNVAVKGKQSSLKKFIKLVQKYPKVPVLKNYLSVLYMNIGNMQKSSRSKSLAYFRAS